MGLTLVLSQFQVLLPYLWECKKERKEGRRNKKNKKLKKKKEPPADFKVAKQVPLVLLAADS